MTRHIITLSDIRSGHIPDHLTGVRWADGTVECSFNVRSDDYLQRAKTDGRRDTDEVEVLDDLSVECDRCADKCG